MLGDELHDQWCGRSSSAAKKADAAFKIPLARLSSAFSRLSLFSSADSSLVVPGRAPASTSAWRHPLAHRLGRADPEQLGDLTHRRPLRLVLIADLSDHPHRPLTQLRRVPLRRTTCMTPTFPRTGVSGHAGAVQSHWTFP